DPRGDADQKAAEQRPGQAADATDDDGNEARHQEPGTHGRLEAELTAREHAAQPGEEYADGEIERSQRADIDAECRHGLEVERAGTDADADTSIAEEDEE